MTETINKHDRCLGIIGMGRLGSCMALCFAHKGYKVIGVDKHDVIMTSSEPMYQELFAQVQNSPERWRMSTDFESVLEADTIFVVVATPTLPGENAYDHSQLDMVCKDIMSYGKQPSRKHLVISCTTMPEYCNKIQSLLDDFNYDVSYNPEFIAQGNIIPGLLNPEMILIGEANVERGIELEALHVSVCDSYGSVHRMSRTEAEITKIALNCFITTKIAFANMVGDCVRSTSTSSTGADRVLSAIGADSRVGSKCLQYGYGFGGPCFPRDNRAFASYLETKGINNHIALATDASNKAHLDYQIQTFCDTSPEEDITFTNVTYNGVSELIDESQQLLFAADLAKRGFNVCIDERPSVVQKVRDIFGDLFTYKLLP
jgi:nucleotide sugar dehydrogenase